MYELIPPEGDKNVGKRVFEVLAAVLADKQKLGLHDLFKKNYKLRRNKHWKTDSASVPLLSANLIFTHLQRSINTLTDNNPIFNVICKSASEEDREKAIDIQRAAEDWWQDEEQQTKLESSVTNGELYGICVEKIVFNEEKASGLGDVETRIVDPMYFGWYPPELTDLGDFQKREAVVEFYVESTRVLKRKYPKLAGKIKSDSDIIDELNDNRREINSNSDKAPGGNNLLLLVQNVVRSVGNLIKAADISEIDAEKTVVCECWVRDSSRIKDGEPVEENGETVQYDKMKYTGGIRYILSCSGGTVVLEDKDNPNINKESLSDDLARETYLYDKFPYPVANSIIDTSNAWGISDIEDVAGLNAELNKALSQFVLEKDSATRKKLKNPKDSGVENHELTSYPSIINPTSAQTGAGIEYLPYPQNTQDIEKAIAMFKELFLLIAGTFDLDQAQTKSNVVAYKAIAALLERAATMQRGKIRNYSGLIRERGRMYASHVQNFYTEDRYVTYKEGGQVKSKVINGQKLIGPIKMTVVNGSTLPVSRVQQREEAIQMHGQGALPTRFLLEKLDWENREEIIKYVESGPIGQVLDSLSSVGVPPELMEYIKSIAQADPEKLQKSIEAGEFPSFPQVMKQLIASKTQQPVEQQTDPEATKVEAETRKLEAAAALDIARADSEKVKQQVMIAGVSFDEDKLKMERAETVHGMEQNIKQDQREDIKTIHDMSKSARTEDREDKKLDISSNQNNKPGYNEQGMKSNNTGFKKVSDFFKRKG